MRLRPGHSRGCLGGGPRAEFMAQFRNICQSVLRPELAPPSIAASWDGKAWAAGLLLRSGESWFEHEKLLQCDCCKVTAHWKAGGVSKVGGWKEILVSVKTGPMEMFGWARDRLYWRCDFEWQSYVCIAHFNLQAWHREEGAGTINTLSSSLESFLFSSDRRARSRSNFCFISASNSSLSLWLKNKWQKSFLSQLCDHPVITVECFLRLITKSQHLLFCILNPEILT